jgi:putative ABC transport system permease protein
MISLVAPHQDLESQVISAGRFRTNTWLVGMTPAYSSVYNQRVVRGRGITSADVSFGREVMLMGLDAAARLFPGQNPIGKTVRVGSHEFEVIGQLSDENLDNRIFVPLPVVTRVMLGGENTVHLSVRVTSASEVESSQDAISEVLVRRHALPPGYPEDFSTQDQASILEEGQAASTTFKALTFALGGISLLVGGIGIMNMMLVSVHERTREIGIRKSVGASPFMVQAQFLIEAIVLSTLGGIAGVLAGIGAVSAIGSLAGWETLISVPSLVIAFAVALAIGLVFGYYPARRASRLDPIAALRYE